MFAKGQALFAGAGAGAASAQPFVTMLHALFTFRSVGRGSVHAHLNLVYNLKLSTNAQHELCSFFAVRAPTAMSNQAQAPLCLKPFSEACIGCAKRVIQAAEHGFSRGNNRVNAPQSTRPADEVSHSAGLHEDEDGALDGMI